MQAFLLLGLSAFSLAFADEDVSCLLQLEKAEVSLKSRIEAAQKQLPVIPSDKFRGRLLATQAEFQGKCPERARRNECDVSRNILGALVEISHSHAQEQAQLAGTRSQVHSSTETKLTTRSAMAVSLHHWLHSRRPFESLDADKSGKISFEEANQGMRSMGLTWDEGERMFPLMDNDHDGELSRDDVFTFLRASVMIRHKIPEIDIIDPEARTEEALHKARAATIEGYGNDLRLPFGWKCVVMFLLPFIVGGLHYLLRTYGPDKLVGKREY